MCGISGFNWDDKGLGAKMSECLIHRGPDASGLFSEEGITLAHRRLSVIDLSSLANQPMMDNANELIIIFNGEIYNFKNLREELKGEYDFKTESDTEVLLAGYRKWGKGIVNRLNGIFSFALWDRRNKSLFIARDHIGVKPLFYSWDESKFIFASEIKAILVHDIPRKIDLDAFNQYLRVLYVPEPKTMIQGISKLPPGHFLTLQNGAILIEKYYSPKLEIKQWSYKEAKKKVKEAVEEAVNRQLVSDVPVGVYLSGGIDSSAILASVSKVKKNVKTFSVGFDLEEGEEKAKFNRDFELAAETAKYFGAEHHPLIISVKDVAESLEDIIGSMDDPISNPTAIPMAHLSKFAKKEVTVVLSGNGGDELFGGYARYRTSRIADILEKIPGLSKILPRKIKEMVEASALNRLVQFEFEKDKKLTKVVRKEYFQPSTKVQESFNKYIRNTGNKTEDLMLVDLTSWLPDQSLALSDRMSMNGSLEERVPFLDIELVNLAMSFPISYKTTLFKTKRILKEAFRSVLPRVLFNEPKRGWFSPGAKWLRRPEIQAIARKVLSEDYYEETRKLFDWLAVKKMLDDHINKQEYNLTALWMILTFQIWAKRYKITVIDRLALKLK